MSFLTALHSPLLVAGWTLFGCILLVLALKLFDALTPGKLQEQVFRDRNTSAAVVYGAALVGFAIIIASAMH
ncbi:MAG TPA: DUF350 domain-containing protein [Opitutaceae bacterium]|nr:DUF350 domain-containing protein [Opitutaceae bacterium]